MAVYAYPTSEHATNAKRNADRVAKKMIANNIEAWPMFVEACGYDRMVEKADRLVRA